MATRYATAGLLALGLAAVCLPRNGAKADPITDTFTMSLAGTAVASGSFTYDSSVVGDVSYADLTAFQVTLGTVGTPYTLSFVQSATDYVYFLFDPSSVSFVSGTGNGFDGPFSELLGAINSSGTDGFFFSPLGVEGDGNGVFQDYVTGYGSEFDTVTFAQAAIPEPASLAALIVGISAIGLLKRRRTV